MSLIIEFCHSDLLHHMDHKMGMIWLLLLLYRSHIRPIDMHIIFILVAVSCAHSSWLGGVAKVDCRLPDGIPLAGFNHGARRVKDFPLPVPLQYTTFMTPSAGVKPEGMWCRALTLKHVESNTSVSFITLDAVGADGTIRHNAIQYALAQGFSVPESNVILSASHSHSGPGAITSEFLWAIAPATDLMVNSLAISYATKIATALVQSEQSMRAVRIDASSFNLTGLTHNRRCGRSKYVQCDTIDPRLGILRVDDDATGKSIAVLWNYAMHGTCYGPDNMQQSGDIMGMTNAFIENTATLVILILFTTLCALGM
jgi:hypothetical protein